MKKILLFIALMGCGPLKAMDSNQLVKVKREPGLIEEADQNHAKRAALVLTNERQVAETNGTDRTMLVSQSNNSAFDRAVLTRSQDGFAAIDLEEEPFASMGNEQSNKRGRNAEDFDLEALADLGAVKKERMDGEGNPVEPEGTQLKPWASWHEPFTGTVEELGRLLAENRVPIYENGWTILHSVVMAGNVACLQVLLNRNIDLAIGTNAGVTALHVAALYGQKACLDALIKAGAKVDELDKNGSPPIYYAIRWQDSKESVEALINAGANLEWTHKKRTLLHFAALTGRINCLKLLIGEFKNRGLSINYQSRSLNTPLAFAVSQDNIACTESLIAAGAAVTSRDFRIAANYGSINCLELLLLNDMPDFLKTPIGKRKWCADKLVAVLSLKKIEAVAKKSHELEKTFIQEVAELALPTKRSEVERLKAEAEANAVPPLCASILKDDRESAAALIAAGADLQWKNPKNRSSLMHLAAEQGSVNCLRLLIEELRKRNLPLYQNDAIGTPLQRAIWKDQRDCIEVLIADWAI